jgi:chromosome segregation and condensation protein ScpB
MKEPHQIKIIRASISNLFELSINITKIQSQLELITDPRFTSYMEKYQRDKFTNPLDSSS